LHDVIKNGEFNEKRLSRIDAIFVKSNFHRSLYPEISDDKFVIIPNGINSQEFSLQEERDPFLLINTSSPDRGLRCLVDMFPEIKRQVPEAKLKWAYGWGVFDVVHGDNPKMMEWKNKLVKDMEKNGVENLGRLSHPEVNKLYQQAKIFAYPSEFAEIDCISLTKAFAGGAIPVSVDFAAHGEKKYIGGEFVTSQKNKDNWCQPYQYDFSITNAIQKEEWIKAVVSNLRKETDGDLINRSEITKRTYDWDSIASFWINTICQL
jgi:glycosyltransferase involved in cell wall biosynthesis